MRRVMRVRLPCAVLMRMIVVVVMMFVRMPVMRVGVCMPMHMIVPVGVLMPVASCSRVHCHCPISYFITHIFFICV